jgi:hypothetical protein
MISCMIFFNHNEIILFNNQIDYLCTLIPMELKKIQNKYNSQNFLQNILYC